MLIDAAFQKTDCQGKNSAGGEASEALQDLLRDDVGVLVDGTFARNHSRHDSLKEISA